jgi:hypothetical protein
MFCNYCGAGNPADALFCSSCGRGIPPPARTKIPLPYGDAVVRSQEAVVLTQTVSPLTEVYGQMTNEQLAAVYLNRGNLPREAQEALDLELSKREVAADQHAETTHEKGSDALIGVGGWLSLLIFGLVIGGPAVNLFGFVKELQPQTPSDLSGLGLFIDGAITLGLSGFGIYAGVLLWRIQPNGPRVARSFFIAVFFVSVASVLLMMSVRNPSASNSDAYVKELNPPLRSLIAAIIWYSYLRKSKRVRATYRS